MRPVASPMEAPSRLAVMRRALEPRRQRCLYSVEPRLDERQPPFGRETFIRREDAERFIEEVRREDSRFANFLQIEEHELETGGLN